MWEVTMDTPGLMQSNKRVCLSFKRRGSCGVVVMRYSCYANGFWFDSHLANFTFLTFFQAHVLPLRVLGLRIRIGQGYVRVKVRFGVCLFTFTSIIPSLMHFHHALLLCHRQRIHKFSNFKINRRIHSHCLICADFVRMQKYPVLECQL